MSKDRVYVGLVDGSMEPVAFDTLERAEKWIADMEGMMGNAVKNGDFYIDAPEGMVYGRKWVKEREIDPIYEGEPDYDLARDIRRNK